jgi:eukaryotic-like serine/threonine-protein kinase
VAAVLEDTLAPGQIIAGRFRLQRMLGRGGMGSIWEARHLSLETEVAIKFVDPVLSRRGDIRSRFAQEATTAARIRSANVVSVLDHGFTEDGRGFIAMELLRGEDLGQRLDRDKILTPAETAQIVDQACRGLAKAHAVGTIHRDIKPENLFLVEEDDGFLVKILDFGIAKIVGTSGSTHKTDTGQLLGTPLYMSPEQALGRAVDVRSDLFSLALVAYRCLAGRPPFVYDAVGELLVAMSTLVPPPPSEFNPKLPRSLDAWFAAMLLKDPNARSCQSPRDLAESFTAACSGEHGAIPSTRAFTPADAMSPTLPEPPRKAAATGADGGATTDSAVTTPKRSTLRSPRLESSLTQASLLPKSRRSAAFAGMALLAAGALAFAWLARRPPTPTVEPHPSQVSRSAVDPAPAPAVAIHFSAIPEIATLYLDGRALPTNPFSDSRPHDSQPHRLRAEASGYAPSEQSVAMDRDVQVSLVLTPIVVRSAAPSASVTPAPPGKTRHATVPPSSAAPALAVTSAEPALTPPPAAAATAKNSDLSIDRGNPWKPH